MKKESILQKNKEQMKILASKIHEKPTPNSIQKESLEND